MRSSRASPFHPAAGLGRPGRASRSVCRFLNVGPGDGAVGAGRDDGRQVDAEILGQLAHRRLGEHADRLRCHGCRDRCPARPPPPHPVDLANWGTFVLEGPLFAIIDEVEGGGEGGSCGNGRLGRCRCCLARTPAGGRGPGPVPDEYGLSLRLRLRRRGHHVVARRSRRSGRSSAGSPHRDDRRTDVDRRAPRRAGPRRLPRTGYGSSTSDFAVSISTIDVVDLDRVADGLTFQDDDLGLGQTLADVGELELLDNVTLGDSPSTRRRGRRRRVRGRGREGTPPRPATAGRACRTR